MNDFTSEFHRATASEELRFVRHNPTDFSSFRKFQDELDLRFSKTEVARERKERQASLVKWGEIVGSRWATAKLKTIENTAVDEVISHIRSRRFTSFWITGESGSGKSYLAYAILRAYISSGWLTPSQVERISEEVLLGMASTGFEGMNRFNKLLGPKNKIFLFDGVGSKKHYSDKEKQLWEQLIDHIYTNSLQAIFTSNVSVEDFGLQLSDSGASKLEHLVGSHSVVSESTHSAAVKAKANSTSPVKPSSPTLDFGANGELL